MTKKGLIAVLLALLTALTPVFASAAPNSDYTLVSPYKDVDWSSRKAYKTGLHTHSSVSDGSETFRNMIYAAYEQNYDILSFSEHGITGRAWDKTPFIRPLYLYSYLLGYDKKPLTPEEFAAVTDGSAAVGAAGEARGRGMFCLTGSNELNGVTVTMSHVNGYFLPENVGNMDWGFENGYDYALSLVEKHGGVSHINHPGDWSGTVWDDKKGEFNTESVDLLTDKLLRYPSCLGVEAVNGFTSVTAHDRVMWDSLLTRCLPYGQDGVRLCGLGRPHDGQAQQLLYVFYARRGVERVDTLLHGEGRVLRCNAHRNFERRNRPRAGRPCAGGH